jgi:hypothetical protein
MTEIRKILKQEGMHCCAECLKAGQQTPATHGTTDAKQTEAGKWIETAERFGCLKHPVAPMVILIDGSQIPFEDYRDN